MNTKQITAILAASFLTGCAMPPQNADVYAGSSSMQARQVALGQVIAVRPIRIRAGSQDGQTGAEVGGLGGAGAGAALGGMKGAIIGALAGVGLGALVGGQQTRAGELVTVRFITGQVRAFAQPTAAKERPFVDGERVEVVIGRRDRVLPLS
jgi:outer membrane lipoprotein SlyB